MSAAIAHASSPGIPAARTYPARRDDVRLLALDPVSGRFASARSGDLPALLAPGDLVVLNDAATLPAALPGRDAAGRAIEARLAHHHGGALYRAALLGAGSWRERTEERPPPPPVPIGAWLDFGADGTTLSAEVVAHTTLSPRLVDLRFDRTGDALAAALYHAGRPVQYAHLAHELPLWAVENVYASRPWAFEMPSAGRPLSWRLLGALEARGVRLATITHAAGLSATGDPAIDAALPLPERFDIPVATVAAIAAARARGGRVVAIGTSVVRALEGAPPGASADLPAPGVGITDLRIGASYRPRVVDGLLSGVHDPRESHFHLLAAFAEPRLLAAALAHAAAAGFHSHELGDLMLVLPGAATSPAPSSPPRRTGSSPPG